MADYLALAVMASIALSCGLAVLFWHYVILPALKALRAWLQPGDDPFGNAAYGDWPFVPTEDFKAFHSATDTEGMQQNHGAR